MDITLNKNFYSLYFPNIDLYEITHESQEVAVMNFEAFLDGMEYVRKYGPIGGWNDYD